MTADSDAQAGLGPAIGVPTPLEAARATAQGEAERRAKRAGWLWPLFVVGLLALPVIFGGWLAWEATHDPGFALEKDYYKKAVDWDQHMAQAQRNVALGWKLSLKPIRLGDGEARLWLSDARDLPVTGAKVELVALFVGQAGIRQEVVATEQGGGDYVAQWRPSRAGLHELAVTVIRGADTFTWSRQLVVSGDSTGAR